MKMITDDIAQKLNNNKDVQTVFVVSSGAEIEICAILKKADKNKKAKITASLVEIAKHYPDTIHLTVSDVTELSQNPHLAEKMLRQGKLVVGQPPEVTVNQLKLKPFIILNYNLSKLSHKEKMLIKRELYGKKTHKNYKGKTYISQKKGLLEKLGGKRVGKAALLLQQDIVEEAEAVLRSHGAITTKTPVWISK
jgi:hypothetical protein